MEANKNRNKKLPKVLIIWVLTLAAMIIVYSLEFTVSASTDESLEAAINDYNFTTDVAVDVLDKESVGKHLFVIYSQTDHDGWGGIARLERGILGKYRFKNCDNTNWQLYNAKSLELGNHQYLLVYSLNPLPQVASFTIEDEDQTVIYQSEPSSDPFVKLIPMDTTAYVSNRSIRYYDETGMEISADILSQQFSVSDSGDGASVGSAEQGLIYVFLGIIFLAGVTFTWPIFKSGVKKKEDIQ